LSGWGLRAKLNARLPPCVALMSQKTSADFWGFFTEVRDECRKQFCLSWLPRAVDFKVSCSQILRRAFAGTLWLRVRHPNHSAYHGYPELWILRYPAHRYHAVSSPGFEPIRPFGWESHVLSHTATTLHKCRLERQLTIDRNNAKCSLN
jgi:hypothetical protein